MEREELERVYSDAFRAASIERHNENLVAHDLEACNRESHLDALEVVVQIATEGK